MGRCTKGKQSILLFVCGIHIATASSPSYFVPTAVQLLTNQNSETRFPYAIALGPKDILPAGEYEIHGEMQLKTTETEVPRLVLSHQLEWKLPRTSAPLGWTEKNGLYFFLGNVSFKDKGLSLPFYSNENMKKGQQVNLRYHDELWFDYLELDENECQVTIQIEADNPKLKNQPSSLKPDNKVIGLSEASNGSQATYSLNTNVWLPRNALYLITRMLGLSMNKYWYYHQVQNTTVIERLLHHDLKDADTIELVFLPGTELVGAHVRLNTSSLPFQSEKISINNIPMQMENTSVGLRVRLFLGEIEALRKTSALKGKHQPVFLSELSVYVKGNKHEIENSRPLQTVVFLNEFGNQNFINSPTKLHLNRRIVSLSKNRKRVVVDLRKFSDLNKDLYLLNGWINVHGITNKWCTFKPEALRLVASEKQKIPLALEESLNLDHVLGGPFIDNKNVHQLEWIKNDASLLFADIPIKGVITNHADLLNKWSLQIQLPLSVEKDSAMIENDWGAIDLVEISSNPTKEIMDKFTRSQYIISEHKLLFFDIVTKKIDLITEDAQQITMVKNMFIEHQGVKPQKVYPRSVLLKKLIGHISSEGLIIDGAGSRFLTLVWLHPVRIKKNTLIALDVTSGDKYIKKIIAEIQYKSGKRSLLFMLPNKSFYLNPNGQITEVIDKITFRLKVAGNPFQVKLKKLTLFHPSLVNRNNLGFISRPIREWTSLPLGQVNQSKNTLTSIQKNILYGVISDTHQSRVSWTTPINQSAHVLEILRFSYNLSDSLKDFCWLTARVHGENHISNLIELCSSHKAGELLQPINQELSNFDPDEKILYVEWNAQLSSRHSKKMCFKFELALMSDRGSSLKSYIETALFQDSRYHFTPQSISNEAIDKLLNGDKAWISYGNIMLPRDAKLYNESSTPYFQITQFILTKHSALNKQWSSLLKYKMTSKD